MLRLALAAALILACAAPAEAGAKRELVIARVPVDDLDLASEAGARTMLRRLNVAAGQICAYARTPLIPSNAARAWRCRTAAVRAAVERLDAPRLALAFAEQLSADPARP